MSLDALLSAWVLFLALPVGLLLLASGLERRRLRKLVFREHALRHKIVLANKQWTDPRPVARVDLAKGSVVVAAHPIHQFLAPFRLLVGGELRGYSSLFEQARREALARMQESSPRADLYLGVRYETSSITASQRLGVVEVFAYATAIRFVRTLEPISQPPDLRDGPS